MNPEKEDGNRGPHRNRDITITYGCEEDGAINLEMVDTISHHDKEDVEINFKGDSDEHRIPIKQLIKRFNTNIEKGLTQE